MKLNTEGLRKVIARMVNEELKKQLPRLVARHLSEQYIRNMVSEAVDNEDLGGGRLSEALDIPSPPKRTVESQRRAAESKKIVGELVRKHAVVSPVLAEDNPFSFIYEGTVPIDEAETEIVNEVPLEALGLGDPERLKRAAGL